MIYYRRYVGDYLRKTARLSLLEHGAYCVMLDHYYTDELPLPADKDEIYTMVRAMAAADRKAVDKVLRMFFEKRDDGYHNERADHEIEVAQKARNNGKGGGRPSSKNKTGSETGSVTDDVTETGTEHETGTVTGGGGGSVHPLAVNHLAFQPSSLSTSQPPTGSPPGNQPANRAAAIAVLIRNLEKQRGKAPKITSTQPIVQQWAQQGVTDAQLKEAYEIAVADREAVNDGAPINAGFLDVFLAKILNPSAATTRVNGTRKPWYADTWKAIVEKGAEKDLKEADFDSPPAFKAAVLKAHGITPEDVRKAEVDFA